jgi:osomolarity two-component system response regulator SKN7
MNDILPKPFTKEGLLQILEKHLFHLKKPSLVDPLTRPSPAPAVSAITLPGGRGAHVKDEDSPQKSPATMSNWHSPNNITGMSPAGSAHTDDYASSMGVPGHHPVAVYGLSPHAVTQLGPNGIPYTPTGPPRRHIGEISGGEDVAMSAKRQQMYAPPMGQLGGMGRR